MKTKTAKPAPKPTGKKMVSVVMEWDDFEKINSVAKSEDRPISNMIKVLCHEAMAQRGLAVALACLLFVSGCKFNEAVQAQTNPDASLRALGQGKDNTK